MNKLSNFNPKIINKRFFKSIDPAAINRGQCFIWAYYAYLMFEDVSIWYNNTHAFVKHNGKFYDSQSLNGEDCWLDLRAACGCDCKNSKCHWTKGFHAKRTSIEKFKKVWGEEWGQTHRFNITWELLEENAKIALMELK